MIYRPFLFSIISVVRTHVFAYKSNLSMYAHFISKNLKNHGKSFIGLVFLFAVAACISNSLYAQSVLTTINLGPEAGNGLNPANLVVNHANNKVYVTNYTTNNITVIDGSTNQVADTIDIEGESLSSIIAVNPNTDMVYAASFPGFNPIPLTDPASATGEDTLFVPIGDNISINVIDGSINQVVDSIVIKNAFISDISINPSTNMIYVAGNTDLSGIVAVIDGSNNQVVDIILIENTFLGNIAINPDTNTVYVISNTHERFSSVGVVHVIDGEENRVVDTISIRNTHIQNIVVNPNTNAIYIAGNFHTRRFFSTIVNVINGANNQVVDSIIMRDMNINDIAVNSDTNIVYVSSNDYVFTPEPGIRKALGGVSSNLGVISVINGANNQVVDTISLTDTHINSIAVNPGTDMLYITDSSKNSVSVINGSNNQVEDNITTGVSLGSIAVNNNTNRVYATNLSTYSINVIDSSNNQVINTIEINDMSIDNVTVNSATNTIYVAGNANSSSAVNGVVLVIDGTNNQVVDTITMNNMYISTIAVNENTNRVYVVGNAFNLFIARSVVRVIDGARNLVVDTIVTKDFVRDISINSGTNTIYITDTFGNKITVVDGSTNRITETIFVKGMFEDIAVNTNTNMVYVASFSEIVNDNLITDVLNLIVIDGAKNQVIDTITITELERFVYGQISIDVNHNTNMVYIADSSRNSVTVINGADNQVVGSIEVGKEPIDIGVNISNDLVYVSNRNSGNVTVIQNESM